jgi:hypothetical protein
MMKLYEFVMNWFELCEKLVVIWYLLRWFNSVTVVTVVAVIVCYGGESWKRERKVILLLMSWQ